MCLGDNNWEAQTYECIKLFFSKIEGGLKTLSIFPYLGIVSCLKIIETATSDTSIFKGCGLANKSKQPKVDKICYISKEKKTLLITIKRARIMNKINQTNPKEMQM